MTPTIKIFDDAQALSIGLAGHLLFISKTAIEKNGKFTIALSGGTTPKRLFKLLAEEPYRNAFDWSKMIFFWVDERFVPLDNEESNAGNAIKILFDKIDIPPKNVQPVNVSLPIEQAATEYEKLIKQQLSAENPNFDCILLGIGEDGHTASLFPGSPLLHENKKLVESVYEASKNSNRITFTLPLINNAQEIIFLVEGAAKSEILLDVLQNENQLQYPAQLVKPSSDKLSYYIDVAAAAKL